jgi:SAM-dependent methyltransferase
MNCGEHYTHIRSHFSALAGEYDRLKARNGYYNGFLTRWCKALVPPGRAVLDVGCGLGDVLAAVEPARGLGIDLSPEMVAQAQANHPEFDFIAGPIEQFVAHGQFDAALCVNTLEYMWDVGTVFDAIHSALRDNGRLLVTTANPLWSPIFHTASSLGLRIPECRRLFITKLDLVNMLELHGFDIVYQRMDLALPKRIPALSAFVNWTLSRIPGLRHLCSTQLLVARKRPSTRREYSASIVIPCHNERDNVRRCIEEVRRLGTGTEIIFVDDGSTDGTASAIDPDLNSDVEVRVISYQPNQGKGHAIKVGFDAARGDILVIVDADLTTHPEELQPLYEAIATGRAEFVNGTRFVYPMEGQAMKWLNYMGNRVFTILVSLIMERRVSDTLCGTKAMFRSDYRHMTMGRDPWGDYDVLFGAAQLRLVVKELPVHYRERLAGQSKMKALRHMLNLLRMCWWGFWQVKTIRPLPAATPEAARAPMAAAIRNALV